MEGGCTTTRPEGGESRELVCGIGISKNQPESGGKEMPTITSNLKNWLRNRPHPGKIYQRKPQRPKKNRTREPAENRPGKITDRKRACALLGDRNGEATRSLAKCRRQKPAQDEVHELAIDRKTSVDRRYRKWRELQKEDV